MRKKVTKRQDKYKPSTVAWRFYVVLGVILCIYSGLIARSAYIQVIEPDMLKNQGDKRSLRTAYKKVQRGTIVDRNGDELAVSVPVETIWADPQIVMKNNALKMKEHWQALADVLDQDVKKLTRRVLKSASKRFVYIERQVSPAMAKYVKQLKIPGIYLTKESKRFYPAGEISAHIVGFTNVDDKGIEGVERLYEQRLTGTNGKQQYRKDAKGRKIEIIQEQDATLPKNVQLSIDQRIQALAYKELKGAVKAFKATSGSVVVTNVHTGEILAMVNSPSYNPNNRRNTAIHRFRNRAITDIYEPGSIIKPLSILSALEFGHVAPDTTVNTSPGYIRLGGRRVSDPRNYGEQSLTDILVNSSNVGTTKLALGLPKAFFLDKFFEAGFGEDTGTGLIGESSGIMHDRNRWSKIELATLSYGMGVAATPLQIARFYSAIGNGGIKRPLSILKTTPENNVFNKAERIYSQEFSDNVANMLEQVVEQHVETAVVEGYRVGGKTGTAFKAMAGSYGNDYVGLFAGIAPITKPELSVVVVINEPSGDMYHGGEVAAPVFSRVMKGALHLLNIAPDKSGKQAKVSKKNTSTEKKDEVHNNV